VSTPAVPASSDSSEQTGSQTGKLVSLGLVFVLIGALIVYAPQIVSAATRFPRRLLRRPPKVEAKPAPPQPSSQPIATVVPEHTTIATGTTPAPPPELPPLVISPGVTSEQDEVVSRLQQEIRSSWSKTN